MDENEQHHPSSSLCYYRQTASSSVTLIHEPASESHGVVIPMESSIRVPQNIPAVDPDQPEYTTEQLNLFNRLVDEKLVDELNFVGGVPGIATTLKTNAQNGIDGNSQDIKSRRGFFGSNAYPAMPLTKSFLQCLLEEFGDLTNLILGVCAALYLVFGMKQHGAKGWCDGASIFAALFLVISISSTIKFKQNLKFDSLVEVDNKFLVIVVVRDGRRQHVSMSEIVVGDVVCLKIGDRVPADGLLIQGHSLRVDESSLTGQRNHVEINRGNPFLSSGTKVADGLATMLVTAVGINTSLGRKLSTLIRRKSNEKTPLQNQCKGLVLILKKVGSALALLVLVMLLVFYFTGKTRYDDGNTEFTGSRTNVDDLINSVVHIIATSVVTVVLAIPGGLSLAIMINKSIAIKRMRADHQLIVKNHSACDVMASITTVCTDMKTMIIASKYHMKVLRFFLGKETLEGRSYTSFNDKVFELFLQGIRHTNARVHSFFPVSPIDETIWSWAVTRLNMEKENIEQFSTLDVKASCSEGWRIGVSLKNQFDNMIHLHWKGDADKIIASCFHYFDSAGNRVPLSDQDREIFRLIIADMASSRLRCIAFAHRELSEVEYDQEVATNYQEIPDSGLTILGVVGLEDCIKPGVKIAIDEIRGRGRGGVHIKLVTSENITRSRALALECGLLSPGQEMDGTLVVEAQEFFNYSVDEQKLKAGDIRVMAMSSDGEKLQMVRLLRDLGEVVAVTGDSTNDAPALHEADIGLAMGIAGAEVAKESSDIVILDDNFAAIVPVLRWGRIVYSNIQKFINFQLTVNVAALVINLVSVALSSGELSLTVSQLLWVNAIIGRLGALALAATDEEVIYHDRQFMRSPVGPTDHIITNVLCRNIIGQSSYQIAVVLTLHFKGEIIFGVHKRVIDSIIFTTFVLCQVFNLFNSRRLEKLNVFKKIFVRNNKLFIGIIGIIIVSQVVLMEFLNKFAHTERLDWRQWAACIGMAAFSWPLDWLIKCIKVPQTPSIIGAVL